MKKFFSILATLLMAASAAMAQDHVQFLGIELTGSHENFKQQLLQIPGVEFTTSIEGVDAYTGPYSGYNGAEYYVAYNDNDVVYSVDVYLPQAESWIQLKRQYIATVAEYQDKDNFTLSEHAEEFEGFYNGGDGRELEAVDQGICSYYSTFTCPQGYVSISISKYRQLKLVFWDNGSESATSSGTLRIMGIDLVGSITKLAKRFEEERGFVINEDMSVEGMFVALKGRFTGLDNCELYLATTSDSQEITLAMIYLPEQSSWNAIKKQYLTYKQNYDQKYSLVNATTGFTGSYSEGDGNEVEAVRNEACNYTATYAVPGGSIQLSISKYMQVEIIYKYE
ncbi:MAG: hypothetical protein ACI4AM_01390 [Muribaculaceae bacterium]